MNMEYSYWLQEQLSYIYIWVMWTFSCEITTAICDSSSLIYEINRLVLWRYYSISLFLLKNTATHPGCVCFLPTDISPTFWFTLYVAGLHGYLEAEIVVSEWLISFLKNPPCNKSIPERKDLIICKIEYLRYESKFMQFYSSSSSSPFPSLGHRNEPKTKKN